MQIVVGDGIERHAFYRENRALAGAGAADSGATDARKWLTGP
jgi:hypothetical protein